MKSYVVTLETTIVVEAEDEDAAEQMALDGKLEDYDGWNIISVDEWEDN